VEGSLAGYQPRVEKPTAEIAAPSAGTSVEGWMNQFSPSATLGEPLTSDADAVAIPMRELIRKADHTRNERRTMSNAPRRVNRNAMRDTPGTKPTPTALLQYHRDLWSTQRQTARTQRGWAYQCRSRAAGGLASYRLTGLFPSGGQPGSYARNKIQRRRARSWLRGRLTRWVGALWNRQRSYTIRMY